MDRLAECKVAIDLQFTKKQKENKTQCLQSTVKWSAVKMRSVCSWDNEAPSGSGLPPVVVSTSVLVHEEPGTKNWEHLGTSLPSVKIQALPWQVAECLRASAFSGIKWEQQYPLRYREVVRIKWNNPGTVLRTELARWKRTMSATGNRVGGETGKPWEPGNLDSHPVSETLVCVTLIRSHNFSELRLWIQMRGKR